MVNALLLSILAALLAYEAEAWFPRFVALLIRTSVSALPKRQRERFREEWQAHVDEIPGAIMKIWHAAGFMIASRRMFPRWRQSIEFKRSLARGSFAVRATVRLLDLTIATGAIVFLLPLLICAAISASVYGSPFITQRVVGRGGKEFYIYRFRTMPQSQDDGPVQRTRVGRFLARTSIDELPTLINVLRGEMGMFGPRPTMNNNMGAKPGIAPLSADPPTASNRPRSVIYYVFKAVLYYFTALWKTVRDVLNSNLYDF